MPDLLVVVPKLLKPKQGASVDNHGVLQTPGVKVPRMNYPYQSVQCQKMKAREGGWVDGGNVTL